MERAYLDYSRLRCSKPDTRAANAFAAMVGVAQSILKRFQPESLPGTFFCPVESIWASAGKWVTPDFPKCSTESDFDSGGALCVATNAGR